LKKPVKKLEERNVTLFLMDAECMGFPDNNFDYVVTTFALYLIPNPLKALKEMRRFSKPSGELIATNMSAEVTILLLGWKI
jgi:phosphatidylethanolamine/phosphatidyl-N-methylethanolamine N-methyltransferase